MGSNSRRRRRVSSATTYYTGTSGVGRAIDLEGAREGGDPHRNDRPGRRNDRHLRARGRRRALLRDRHAGPDHRERILLVHQGLEGKVDIVLGDARLSIERETPQNYDVLAVDAFSGDAIPAHLITREAVQSSASISRRTASLPITCPIATWSSRRSSANIAEAEGMTALQIDDFRSARAARSSRRACGCCCRGRAAKRSSRCSNTAGPPEEKPWRMWTDDYHNLFQVLRPPPSLN